MFAELDDRVHLHHPSWLRSGPAVVLHPKRTGSPFVLVDGEPVAFAVGGEGPTVEATSVPDADEDGIPDLLDVLIGAKKTVLNGAAYQSSYRELDYPMGDVPREQGVCTDVIIRALRNAGYDLQALLAEDIKAHPSRYPQVEEPDPNIDHRRVKNLLPYFQAHWQGVPADTSRKPLLPGDVCFMDTMHGPEPEHMGIVSDRLGKSGRPLIINNWNDGTRTSEMDLLSFVPITHRFRPKTRATVQPADRGLVGLLARHGLEIADEHRQLLLVTVATWDRSAGSLQRYRRNDSGHFVPMGDPRPVRIGKKGLGRGRGLHDATALQALSPKKEGDRKSPAGAFGPQTSAPYQPARWPWRSVGSQDRFVDDPTSPFYNSWQKVPPQGAPSWSSAEKLSMYELGLVVHHNRHPTKPGAGSAIFMHTWKNANTSTIGCTALSPHHLKRVLSWLDPAAKPAIVQVAGALL